MAIRIGLAGVGEIARRAHAPAIAGNLGFELCATASPAGALEGVESFHSLGAMLAARPELEAVSVCAPPQHHFALAREALLAGKHVLLEKPPTATLAEFSALKALAAQRGLSLFQAWHSREAAAVAPARAWLAGKAITAGAIAWREDARIWHPGQAWLFQAGGFGVFDPGINALSILTALTAEPVLLARADLKIPANQEAPIAADLALRLEGGAEIAAAFDFRHAGAEIWRLSLETAGGLLTLDQGGARWAIDGQAMAVDDSAGEYRRLYQRFSALIALGESEADGRPFELVADAFLIGRRSLV